MAVPGAYVWLAMFYSVFHLFLNIMGELTQFGDRRFYSDWWNAGNLGEYWRKWNQPIHNWLQRHMLIRRQIIIKPKMSLKMTHLVSIVFFQSLTTMNPKTYLIVIPKIPNPITINVNF